MSQISKKFLAAGAVAKLLNNTFFQSRNAADSGDVNLLKLNASDRIEFASLPQATGTPSSGADLVNKTYADSITGSGATPQLDNLSAVAINAALLPDTDTNYALGSPTKRWTELFAGAIKSSDTVVLLDVEGRLLKNAAGVTAIDFSGSKPQVGAPSVGSDITNKTYVDGEISTLGTTVSGKVAKSGDTMSGNLAMGGNKVTGLAAPTANGDALRFDALGANNGIATLDSGGKVPVSQLPATAMIYKGTWNATSNSPSLADGTGTSGWFYVTATAGTQDLGSGSQTFVVGDWVMYNGTIWQKVVNSNSVVSVNGQTGTVSLTSDNVSEGTSNKYQKTWNKENLTLNGTDITNQYKDLAQVIVSKSLDLVVNGVMQIEDVDYTISLTGGAGGKTRVTFAGDLATGGAAELISGDILRFKYQY
jgi:hypothetical protein